MSSPAAATLRPAPVPATLNDNMAELKAQLAELQRQAQLWSHM